MKNIILIFAVLLLGCASTTGFEKQCTSYGFSPESAEHAICVKRETRELRNYFERIEAEDRAKDESFHRDIQRKRLGLDIK